MGQASSPNPDVHCEVLYRQTNNTKGDITAAGLTQDNRVGNAQKVNNARLNANTNKGILAGSVVAVAGNGLIGPCLGDTTNYDKAVGIAVNDAKGNPYESSSAVASNKCVYMHGTGGMLSTDIYETKATNGSSNITYTAGEFLVSSQNGLLTNSQGVDNTSLIGTKLTIVGIVLTAPTATDPYMTVQLRI